MSNEPVNTVEFGVLVFPEDRFDSGLKLARQVLNHHRDPGATYKMNVKIERVPKEVSETQVSKEAIKTAAPRTYGEPS